VARAGTGAGRSGPPSALTGISGGFLAESRGAPSSCLCNGELVWVQRAEYGPPVVRRGLLSNRRVESHVCHYNRSCKNLRSHAAPPKQSPNIGGWCPQGIDARPGCRTKTRTWGRGPCETPPGSGAAISPYGLFLARTARNCWTMRSPLDSGEPQAAGVSAREVRRASLPQAPPTRLAQALRSIHQRSDSRPKRCHGSEQQRASRRIKTQKQPRAHRQRSPCSGAASFLASCHPRLRRNPRTLRWPLALRLKRTHFGSLFLR
jgi:hypothetical protein